MHYPAYAFAKDTTKPTIIVPAGKTVGQRLSISNVSILRLRLMWKMGIPQVNVDRKQFQFFNVLQFIRLMRLKLTNATIAQLSLDEYFQVKGALLIREVVK